MRPLLLRIGTLCYVLDATTCFWTLRSASSGVDHSIGQMAMEYSLFEADRLNPPVPLRGNPLHQSTDEREAYGMYTHPGPQPLSDAIDAVRFLPREGSIAAMPPLPAEYGEAGLTLLVQDPHCLFAFWEGAFDGGSLEVYATDDQGFPRQIVASAPVVERGSLYVNVPYANCRYVGILTPVSGPPLQSAVVATPPSRPSEVVDEAWMTIEGVDARWHHVTSATSPGRRTFSWITSFV